MIKKNKLIKKIFALAFSCSLIGLPNVSWPVAFANSAPQENEKAKIRSFAENFFKQAKNIASSKPNASAKDFDDLFNSSFDFDLISDYILNAALGKSFTKCSNDQKDKLKKLCTQRNKSFYLNQNIIQNFKKSNIEIQRIIDKKDGNFKIKLKITMQGENNSGDASQTYIEISSKNKHIKIVNLVVFGLDLRQTVIADLKNLFVNKANKDVNNFINQFSR